MQNAPLRDKDDSAVASRLASNPVPDGGSLGTEEMIMWSLIIGGVLMVCFAGSIGYALAPKDHYAQGSFQWNLEDARNIAVVVRSLGFMAFAAGLVERIVLAISRIKS